jgi:hypothetical protein
MVFVCRALDPLTLLVVAEPLGESRSGAGCDWSEVSDPLPPP